MNDRNERIGLMRQLWEVAHKDGAVQAPEIDFLKRIGGMLKLVPEELELAFSNKPMDVQLPATEQERLIQFYRMVLLMNIDLKVDANELQYVRNMGTRMGLSAVLIEAVFDEMRKHQGGMIPEDKLVGIFRTVNN